MSNTNMQVVPLEQATNAELMIASHFAGADEAEADVVTAASGPELSQVQRQLLITYLNSVGYYNIQIKPDERINDPDALIPFEVALPV